MLDQCLTTIITHVLQPWSAYMQQKSGDTPPTKYQETFTACTGIIRNLSSYSLVLKLISFMSYIKTSVRNRTQIERESNYGTLMVYLMR